MYVCIYIYFFQNSHIRGGKKNKKSGLKAEKNKKACN
jgi:hypothetical protein